MSYKMPTFRLDGVALLYFAAWKTHLALYPTSPAMESAFGEALAPHRAAKSSLHFKLSRPLPVELIERIAAFRAAEDYR